MHDDTRPVAFFDSGVGGLPYLESARRLMPDERFVYAADRAGFPYGTKAREAVITLAVGAIAALVERARPKAVVVACNTATELAIEAIRQANPGLPIVGTVPAIKPAAALSRTRRIGVVATQAAARAEYLSDLAARWAADCVLSRIGDGELVDFVERRYLGSTRAERLDAVRPSVEAMLEAGVDVIVLGCTHFLHLSEEFAELAGPGVAIVDSRDGVAARLAHLVGSLGHRGETTEARGDTTGRGGSTGAWIDAMYLTGPGEFGPVYAGFASLFGLSPAGTLA